MTEPLFPKRIRIVSDGTSNGTVVTDADTGIEIPVTKVEWSMQASNLAVARLTLVAASCDMVAAVEAQQLRVVYTAGLDEKMERELDALLARYGWCRWASGFSLEAHKRDIAYERKD